MKRIVDQQKREVDTLKREAEAACDINDPEIKALFQEVYTCNLIVISFVSSLTLLTNCKHLSVIQRTALMQLQRTRELSQSIMNGKDGIFCEPIYYLRFTELQHYVNN